MRGRLAAGQHDRRRRPRGCSGGLTSATSTPSAASVSACSRNAPCSARTPDLHAELGASMRARRLHQPRSASFTSSLPIASPRHRVAEARRHLEHDVGVGVVRGGLHDRAWPAGAGSSLLKMPDCRRTRPARRAASRARRRPAWRSRRRRTTAPGARRAAATSCTSSSGARSSLAQRNSSSGVGRREPR